MPKPRYRDGLYQVTNLYGRALCAGFVIAGGKVTQCAPILRRQLVLADRRPSSYVMRRATRIGD